MGVIEPVVHHPALPPGRGHDPVCPQPAHRVTGSRLAHPSRRGQVTDAHLAALQQRDQQPRPVRVTQQRENVRDLLNILIRRHGSPDGSNPLPVHHPDRSGIDASRVA
jgi:hypothetical protein